MPDHGESPLPSPLTLQEAIVAFVAECIAASTASGRFAAPEDGQIWGTVGSMMGLSKAERKERQHAIVDAFMPAWIAAGGIPRAISPDKARVQKRKKAVKEIKNRRAEIAKIAAANQRGTKAAVPRDP
jgi:hypothetical protein